MCVRESRKSERKLTRILSVVCMFPLLDYRHILQNKHCPATHTRNCLFSLKNILPCITHQFNLTHTTTMFHPPFTANTIHNCYTLSRHKCDHVTIYTVFTRIVAAATINFSLVPVRLLIEGGSYSRAALTISTCAK